jgi:hypothetical protein
MRAPPDIWYPLDKYVEVEGLNSTFFFIPFKRQPKSRENGWWAARYDVGRYRDRPQDQGLQVGLHGSIRGTIPEGRDEVAVIRDITGKKGSRCDALALLFRAKCLRKQVHCDSTSVTTSIGFRSGTTQVFRCRDVKRFHCRCVRTPRCSTPADEIIEPEAIALQRLLGKFERCGHSLTGTIEPGANGTGTPPVAPLDGPERKTGFHGGDAVDWFENGVTAVSTAAFSVAFPKSGPEELAKRPHDPGSPIR